jgi:hypothetical protein
MSTPAAIREPRIGTAAPSSGEFDLLADLRKELEELSAVNREILEGFNSDPALDLAIEVDMAATPAPSGAIHPDYEALLRENEELRARLAELEQGGAGPAEPVSAEEINETDLQRLKRELDQRQSQLDEDEQDLMRQMREMELTMAKDRAELARQRNDLNRLQSDLQRELEMASRDPQLQQRLQTLQRRQQDNQNGRTTDPALLGPVAPATAGKNSSGVLRRLLG